MQHPEANEGGREEEEKRFGETARSGGRLHGLKPVRLTEAHRPSGIPDTLALTRVVSGKFRALPKFPHPVCKWLFEAVTPGRTQ